MVSHISTNRCSVPGHGTHAVQIVMSAEQKARPSHRMTNGHASFGGRQTDRRRQAQGSKQEQAEGRLNWRNSCCFISRTVCLHRWPYTKREIKIYRTITFIVVLYGCETWTLSLREGHRLRVFENRVLREISGSGREGVTGEWRKLHNEELNGLYCWPNVATKMTSRTMRWAGCVAPSGEVTCTYWWGNMHLLVRYHAPSGEVTCTYWGGNMHLLGR